jgi:hypothetical protein
MTISTVNLSNKESNGRVVSIEWVGEDAPECASCYMWYCPCCMFGLVKESYDLARGSVITHIKKFHTKVRAVEESES